MPQNPVTASNPGLGLKGSKASGHSKDMPTMKKITKYDYAVAFCEKHELAGFALKSLVLKKNKRGDLKKDTRFYYFSPQEKKALGDTPNMWGFKIEDFAPGKVLTRNADPKHETLFAVKTGEKSNRVCVLDCDTAEAYDVMVSLYPELEDCLTVDTKKGKHIYVRVPEHMGEILNGQTKVCEDTFGEGGLDIRGEGSCIFIPPTEYMNEETKEVCGYKCKTFRKQEIKEIPGELYDMIKSEEGGQNTKQETLAFKNIRTTVPAQNTRVSLDPPEGKGISKGHMPCPLPLSPKEAEPRYELLDAQWEWFPQRRWRNGRTGSNLQVRVIVKPRETNGVLRLWRDIHAGQKDMKAPLIVNTEEPGIRSTKTEIIWVVSITSFTVKRFQKPILKRL